MSQTEPVRMHCDRVTSSATDAASVISDHLALLVSPSIIGAPFLAATCLPREQGPCSLPREKHAAFAVRAIWDDDGVLLRSVTLRHVHAKSNAPFAERRTLSQGCTRREVAAGGLADISITDQKRHRALSRSTLHFFPTGTSEVPGASIHAKGPRPVIRARRAVYRARALIIWVGIDRCIRGHVGGAYSQCLVNAIGHLIVRYELPASRMAGNHECAEVRKQLRVLESLQQFVQDLERREARGCPSGC
jgi:hypothetical protein